MPTAYTPAEQVESIANNLISKFHRHLLGVDVRYVFKSKASKCAGKVVLGKARKVTGLNAYLGSGETADETEVPVAFFVVEVGADTWDTLSPAQRDALVDHELCHCAVEYNEDGLPSLKIRAHDIEEFREVCERHGYDWKPDISYFVAPVLQMSFESPQNSSSRVPTIQPESEPSGIDSARAALADPETGEMPPKPQPQEETVAAETEHSDTPTEAPSAVAHVNGQREAEPSALSGERIDPEPIPAEARASARRNSQVVPFSPSDVDDLHPPSPTERTPGGGRQRDPELAKFFNE